AQRRRKRPATLPCVRLADSPFDSRSHVEPLAVPGLARVPGSRARAFFARITGACHGGAGANPPEGRASFGTMLPFQQIPHPRESPKRVVSA
ncbi:hypothetical protein NX905_29400, partial [Burkholderia thailandensis]|uniref:hypothetical protein n=1 Tax=Burkholderia thailandensis TaxID=57975 RepID=UPI00217DEFD8